MAKSAAISGVLALVPPTASQPVSTALPLSSRWV